MRTLFASIISVTFMATAAAGSAFAMGPDDAETKVATAATVQLVKAEPPPKRSEMSEAEKAAADDREVARLMAAAPDDGMFVETLVDTETGDEIRVSGFGFTDK